MLLGAFTSGILTMINEYRLREFLFWMVGGLDFRRWDHVLLGLWASIVTGSIILMMLGRHLNVSSFWAIQRRVPWACSVMAYRMAFLFLASVVTATAVCVLVLLALWALVVPSYRASFGRARS